ncbi:MULTISPECIES: exodeoxyribonuclease I [Methylomonas]|uniref:Exodeoxyribonuclease I n=2 Tax=Methylomonas TaxID=416 RepID=A0A140E6Y0_9GAMM|nr:MULTISPECIES: exodeoxyribonuclease I [Methylomonas]AMK79154.1 exodeoxyribonuclease I [Methylomonas denitrificans]OAH99661.1 exodeoxyribonuclease I [Methylomonas methanica]TCV78166.1 exodeoxyribonuclease I subunit C [Methylomonas methanica]
MTTATFFWHDYETFGIDPQRDRPCQFAGIRTDDEFNIVGQPVMAYCQSTDDYLPHPEACLITGITPQLAAERGVCEAAFAALINQQLAEPGTCGVGYNSIRFDDEVTRNLLYRNFYDPYAREWQNGNSRWDIIDVVRAAKALRPEGIEWPLNADGFASFKLEELTKANGIAHEAAHDALSDVYATIAMAKLIKQRQPKLFNYLLNNRYKNTALNLLQLGSFNPLIHISGRFSARNNSLAVILPLAQHPSNSNEIIVYDLSVDPTPLLDLSAEDIQQRLFVATDALPEGIARIPLKTVHINKAPVLAPLSVIRPVDAERLQLDLSLCQANLQRIQAAPPLAGKLSEVFTRQYQDSPTDPDLMIYSGGFFSSNDKALMTRIRQTKPVKLTEIAVDFDDARLPEMLFRYRARNYPHTLSPDDAQQWRQYCRDKLNGNLANDSLTLEQFTAKIALLREEPDANLAILNELAAYAEDRRLKFPD